MQQKLNLFPTTVTRGPSCIKSLARRVYSLLVWTPLCDMAVACGCSYTALVAETGDVWSFGLGDAGQLGLGNRESCVLPASVGGCEVFGDKVVMIAAKFKHTACVTRDGAIFWWGDGFAGALGLGDERRRLRPQRIGKEIFGTSPAVMVACGSSFIIVLTQAGRAWTCGCGKYGRLGHGNENNCLVLTRVEGEIFLNTQIVMVAAAAYHSVALGADAKVWCWGRAGLVGTRNGQDGDFKQSVLRPALVGKDSEGEEAFGGTTPVMIAAGHEHTVVVTEIGRPWAWGVGYSGQLGSGDRAHRYLPQRVGTEDAFRNSKVMMASWGGQFTLFVTEEGRLWMCGEVNAASKRFFAGLGNNLLVPFCIDALHFGHTKITSAAGGSNHAVAVNEHGRIFTWGNHTNMLLELVERGGLEVFETRTFPGGLGHEIGETNHVVTPLIVDSLQGIRIGRCHRPSKLTAIAFAMGTHARLGSIRVVVTVARDGSKSMSTLGKSLDLKCHVGPRDADALYDDGKFSKEVLSCNLFFLSIQILTMFKDVEILQAYVHV